MPHKVNKGNLWTYSHAQVDFEPHISAICKWRLSPSNWPPWTSHHRPELLQPWPLWRRRFAGGAGGNREKRPIFVGRFCFFRWFEWMKRRKTTVGMSYVMYMMFFLMFDYDMLCYWWCVYIYIYDDDSKNLLPHYPLNRGKKKEHPHPQVPDLLHGIGRLCRRFWVFMKSNVRPSLHQVKQMSQEVSKWSVNRL